MTPLETRIKAFTDQVWPNRTITGRISKLGEEIGEFIEALCIDEGLQDEAGDVGIILADILAMKGYSLAKTIDLYGAKNLHPKKVFTATTGDHIEALGYQYGALGKFAYADNELFFLVSAAKIAALTQLLLGSDLFTAMAQKFESVEMKHGFFCPDWSFSVPHEGEM